MYAEHGLGVLARGTLAHLAPEFDAPGPRRCQAGLGHQVASEFGHAGHDGAHQLAACRAEIKAQTSLSQDANLPAMQIVERPHKVPEGLMAGGGGADVVLTECSP